MTKYDLNENGFDILSDKKFYPKMLKNNIRTHFGLNISLSIYISGTNEILWFYTTTITTKKIKLFLPFL